MLALPAESLDEGVELRLVGREPARCREALEVGDRDNALAGIGAEERSPSKVRAREALLQRDVACRHSHDLPIRDPPVPGRRSSTGGVSA
jgi:hypothetical protein